MLPPLPPDHPANIFAPPTSADIIAMFAEAISLVLVAAAALGIVVFLCL